MQWLLPVVARLRGRLWGNPALSTKASEIIELAPAVDREQRAAIALPGEFARVIGVQEETTFGIELLRLREGRSRHGPTIAYRIDNAVLRGGTLYFGGGYQVIHRAKERLPRHSNQDHFLEMQLCSNYVIEHYFGHWVTDGLVLELLAAQQSLRGLKLAGTSWLHEAAYRELCHLDVERSDNARVDRLWVIDDRGINDGWISRIEELRRRVQSKIRRHGTKLVMLTRGSLGVPRNLVNSDELYEALDRLGFEIIDPESETALSMVEKLSRAEMAIGVEGSAQNHCWLAMPARSTFVAIQPPTRFNLHGKMRADAIGINYAFVVADPYPNGFYLPVERLLRTIDEVTRVTAARNP